MKIKKAVTQIPQLFEWPTFTADTILAKFKQLKDLEQEA